MTRLFSRMTCPPGCHALFQLLALTLVVALCLSCSLIPSHLGPHLDSLQVYSPPQHPSRRGSNQCMRPMIL